MNSPLDEDAPSLARVAARALDVLVDATDESVGYPGLTGTKDTEAVVSALTQVADELSETADNLDSYLDHQLQRHQLTTASGSERSPAAAVGVVRGALAEARDAAARMSGVLSAAESTMLEFETVKA